MFGRLGHSPAAVEDKASSLLHIIGCKELCIYMNSIRRRRQQRRHELGRVGRGRVQEREGSVHISFVCLCVCVVALCQKKEKKSGGWWGGGVRGGVLTGTFTFDSFFFFKGNKGIKVFL